MPSAVAPLFDSHCHVDLEQFDADRTEVLARARTAGDLAAFRQEVTDRFGPMPAPVLRLVEVAELRLSAETGGLVVVDEQPADSGMTMIVAAPGPQAVLSWLAANSSAAPFESFAIEPAGNGGVTGSIRFGGSAP